MFFPAPLFLLVFFICWDCQSTSPASPGPSQSIWSRLMNQNIPPLCWGVQNDLLLKDSWRYLKREGIFPSKRWAGMATEAPEIPMAIFAAMWNEPVDIKTRKKIRAKDVMEVMTEMKTMVELLKGFMPGFKPSLVHHLPWLPGKKNQPLLSCPTLCYSSL